MARTAKAAKREFGISVGAGRSFFGKPGIPCLSILQPWAYAIWPGPKRIENRSWGVGFTGPLLLHSGLGASKKADRDTADVRAWFAENLPDFVLPPREDLPRGVIFAAAWVGGACRNRFEAIGRAMSTPEEQLRFCDTNEGTVYWPLRHVVGLAIPIKWRGERQIFRVPSAVVADQLSEWPCWGEALAAERSCR